MSLKIEFVERVQRGEKIAPLCREYGVSRTTGHKWWKRFQELGYAGLEEQSRRPKRTPLATAEDLVLAVLSVRDAHPSWGPKKLAPLLRRRFGEQTPSVRTIARILKRANRVRARPRRRPLSLLDKAPRVTAAEPNEVWTIDFKGWWRAANGQRCEPLTVRDAMSRYVLLSRLCRSTSKDVRVEMEKLFREYGLPSAIQCDNGVPFVSVRSARGLSALSAWWISLGIELVRSRPGCPQDNGAHERMHRDISREVQNHPASNEQTQQRALDKWRQEFNHVRPHEALDNRTPAELYTPSPRRLPRQVTPCYPSHMEVFKVQRNGTFRRRGESYFVSGSLHNHHVGLERIDELHARVWFYEIDVCTLQLVPDISDAFFDRVSKDHKVQSA